MSIRLFELGFVLQAKDYLSPVLKKIEGEFKQINESVAQTKGWREAGTNIAMVGAGMAAAGGALALGLRSTLNAAAAMQGEMAHVATAMSDGAETAAHLAQAQEAAERIAVKSGIAAKEEAEAYYIARSNMLNHTQALAAMKVATNLTIGTTQSLQDAQQQLEPTTRLLTTVFENFGDHLKDPNAQIAAFADTMANLQTKYAFRDISEVNYAMQYAVPLAKSAGIGFNDMAASLALLSRSGLHGAEAGTAFEELVSKLQQGGKLRAYAALTREGGIDLQRTLQNLQNAFGSLPAFQRAQELTALGFSERSERGVALLLDKTKDYQSVLDTLNHSQGAAAAAADLRMKAYDYQVGKLGEAWEQLKRTIGDVLLGPVGKLAEYGAKAIEWVTGFAKAHPTITKLAVAFVAIGAAALVVGGAILTIAGGFAILASFAPALAGLAVPFIVAAGWIAGIGATIFTFGGEIKRFLDSIPGYLQGLPEKLHDAGVNLIKSLADGIVSAAEWPGKAIAGVAAKIRAHLPFSPAKEGPLRDLNRVRIVETIAERITPGPVLAAMRRVATVAAVAAPIIAATATMPVLAPAAAASTFVAGAQRRGASVTIQSLTIAPQIALPAGTSIEDPHKLAAAIVAAIKSDDFELARAIAQAVERYLDQKERTEF